MKRTQLYLDESVWEGLHARARVEKTTISELVRLAIQNQYFSNFERRAQAMEALVGLRSNRTQQSDAESEVRQLRAGTRMSRLDSRNSKS